MSVIHPTFQRWMTALIVAGSIFVAILTPRTAASDVRPDEMVERSVGGISYHFPERFEPAATEIMRTGPKELARLERELGLESLTPIEAWLVPEVDDYFELKEIEGRPPEWAIGLSLSDRGLIIVSHGAGPGGAEVNVAKTFQHELAHVAIDRARQGHHVPRWFNEGFAIMHADEWTPERSDRLARAAAGDALLPLAELDHSFPAHHNTASLAYAQAFFMVRQMRLDHGEDVYARLMKHVREGMPFSKAFKKVTGDSIALAEARWLQALQDKTSIWSMLMDGMLIFFGASILFIVAWLIRRRRAAEQLESMDEGNPGDGWDYDESRYPLPGENK